MPQWVLPLRDFPRRNSFPFRVEGIYYCRDILISNTPRRWDQFEVCIRLPSKTLFTEDVVNGEYVKMPCPNVVWRVPGSLWGTGKVTVRSVISFSYPSGALENLNLLGMNPERVAWSFAMTSELESLIAKFRDVVCNLYTPGAVDSLDWVCFCLMGTLMLQENAQTSTLTVENRIRNASIWFHTHYSENINIDKVAAANGMSHAYFFRIWKKCFDMTPTQYVINLRLEAAARRLLETTLPISQIVREVHFAGEYMFHQRFHQKYGMTPREYRLHHALDSPNAQV